MRISDWSSDVCSSDLPSTSISGGQPDRPTMADFEVHIDLDGRTRPIGLARSNRVRGTETILFEYDDAWLEDPDRFSLEPALALTRGAFAPPAGLALFGAIGDSAPDSSEGRSVGKEGGGKGKS